MSHFKKLLILFCLSTAITACTSTTISTSRHAKDTSAPSVAVRSYTQLEEVLPLYQAAVANPWPTLPDHANLRPGAKNKYVLALRERLKATGELSVEDDDVNSKVFDEKLSAAVSQFQLEHGLEATGAVGPQTLAELNISPEDRVNQIQMNIERWKKLASELSDRYIMVNVPDYRLQVVENGTTVLSMKAIVGKPERRTPEISSVITRVVLNPYWNVPKTIAEKDIVPKVIANPDYLSEMHIEILDSQVDDAVLINPDDVDWQSAEENGFPYHFRQEPGDNNALGLVKFEFNNTHDIYLHDTPAKNLFSADKRAFSSGCIRLENPFALADYLMGVDPTWDDERKNEILETGQTNYIRASRPTDIIITYLTAWVDEQGHIQFRDDVYGEDNPELTSAANNGTIEDSGGYPDRS